MPVMIAYMHKQTLSAALPRCRDGVWLTYPANLDAGTSKSAKC